MCDLVGRRRIVDKESAHRLRGIERGIKFLELGRRADHIDRAGNVDPNRARIALTSHRE